MSDASADSRDTVPQRPEHDPRRSEGRRKFGTGAALVACAIVFSLLVWAAFSLGFARMQADLGIESKTNLEAEPIIQFDAEEQGWTLVRPANSRFETGPEYGNISSAIDAMCVFTWDMGIVADASLLELESDKDATLEFLDNEGFDSNRHGIVRLVSESGQSIELVYVAKDDTTGLDTVVAARTFAGSGDFLIFTMKCERTGELDQEIFQDTLLGVELNLEVGT